MTETILAKCPVCGEPYWLNLDINEVAGCSDCKKKANIKSGIYE